MQHQLPYPAPAPRNAHGQRHHAQQQQVIVLTQQLAEAKAVNAAHDYQTIQSGGMTWHFDKVTGKTCALLASEAWWKKNRESSCALQDAFGDK